MGARARVRRGRRPLRIARRVLDGRLLPRGLSRLRAADGRRRRRLPRSAARLQRLHGRRGRARRAAHGRVRTAWRRWPTASAPRPACSRSPRSASPSPARSARPATAPGRSSSSAPRAAGSRCRRSSTATRRTCSPPRARSARSCSPCAAARAGPRRCSSSPSWPSSGRCWRSCPVALAAPRGGLRIAAIGAGATLLLIGAQTQLGGGAHGGIASTGLLFHPHQLFWPLGVPATPEFIAGRPRHDDGPGVAPAAHPPADRRRRDRRRARLVVAQRAGAQPRRRARRARPRLPAALHARPLGPRLLPPAARRRARGVGGAARPRPAGPVDRRHRRLLAHVHRLRRARRASARTSRTWPGASRWRSAWPSRSCGRPAGRRPRRRAPCRRRRAAA